MDIITGSLMQELDKKTQDSISSSILMDNAGNKMFNIILKYYPNTKNVLILAGSGGNAGDGFVIARLMEEININVAIYLSSDIKNETSKEKFLMLKNVSLVKSLDDLEKYDLIIDALFGIGLKRDLNNEYKSIISIANESMVDIVSLDIPSGIDSTSGISYGAFIKSKLLITVEYAKTGLFLNDGIDSFDKLEIIDVGICHTKDTIHLIQKEDFLSYYTKRLRNTNKGSFGKSSIIAGSVKYPGASLLSYQALASFKMGVGFQNLYLIPSLYNLYSLQHPEIITNKLDEIDGHIKYNEELLDNIIKHSDSISIGMGMEVSQDLYDTIKYLLINYDKTLIIDADGINSLALFGVNILKNKKCNVILTPHLKEFSRLIGKDINDIKSNQIILAKDFAKKYNIVLVLKSATTIITDGLNISINTFGTTGLAKAGSGDSLVGILTGICAYFNNRDNYSNSCLATYMLGRIAEEASKYLEEEAMTISEAVKYIPEIIKEIKNV